MTTDPARPGPFTARHATLEDLEVLLTEQQARKVDIVAAPQALRRGTGCWPSRAASRC